MLYTHSVENKAVYTEATSDMMIDMLKTAACDGTGKGSKFSPNIDIAGKTGTTDSNKDLWFAGFTPSYTSVVWTGYDEPKEFTTNQADSPINIWKNIMSLMYKKGDSEKFTYSSKTKLAYVNAQGQCISDNTSGGHWEIFPSVYEIPEAPLEVSDDLAGGLSLPNNLKQAYIDKMTSLENLQLRSDTQKQQAKLRLDAIVDDLKHDNDLTTKDKEDLLAYANYVSKQFSSNKNTSSTESNHTFGTPRDIEGGDSNVHKAQ